MKSRMYKLDTLSDLIKKGKKFWLAADENLLKQLPKGEWIGGTIPYFMADKGGVITNNEIFATELPDYISSTEIKIYDETNLKNVYKDYSGNGITFIIIPAMSKSHLSFALNAPKYDNFANRPLLGWISGVHLNDLGKISAKIINGKNGEISDQKAIVMNITLPDNMISEIGIINIFEQGSGPCFEFFQDGFSSKKALVDGKEVEFAKYVKENKLDFKLPLVADYNGAMINISFQNIDEKTNQVNFYAPVFRGVKYYQAKSFTNYVSEFLNKTPPAENMLFSCNCILNFLYSELEGKTTGDITGPITFGEIAYQLLNQTLAYVNIYKHS
ncbi:MAG: hypothetical protein HQK49_04940 [Oligoflexia bacterium]|nr:hypothetical protein [Oligoflexia bacterium]